MSLRKPLPSTLRWQPSYVWQRMTRRMPRGRVHIVLMLGDHFEPAYVPRQPRASAPFAEQEARLETWCREYPEVVRHWRDSDGRPFVRSYFFPAEKYEASLLDRLALLLGWARLTAVCIHPRKLCAGEFCWRTFMRRRL